MFWKFNLLTASQIDTLLDQEDVKKGSVTLEDILNEDDVLQECKAQNKRLLDFLVKSENMEELVNLVTKEPGEDKDEKSRFKHPNTACEVLTSDVPAITDKLAGEEALLNKIFAFLETENDLNPLQASFFSKVMALLISRKSELMLEYLKNRDFITHLVRHIGTSAIMDLLLRLITCIGIENAETGNECIIWLHEQSIIQKLVGLIDASHDEDKHCNASQFLCDIIRIGRDKMSHLQEKADDDPLLATIESQEVISELLDHMFTSETKVESVLVNGLQVIQTLLEFRKVSYLYLNSPEGCQEQMTSLDTERLAHGVNNTVAAVTPRLKDLHQLLVNPPRQHYHAMPTTIGDLDPPLGNTRLQIVRLITSLLITNTHSINQELANLGTIAVIVDLFYKYLYNNFLHTQVEQCLCTILNMTPTEVENGEEAHPLLDYLFKELNMLEKILDAWEDHDNNQSKPGAHRPGYMGHLTRIANSITESYEKGSNADKIKELFKDQTEELQQRWEGFVSGTLAEVNKQNTADLGGSAGLPGLQSSSDSEDPDFSHIPFPQESAMQQAFSDYQLQQMTSTFIDQFGFNEDEFAEQEERVDAPFTDKISSINFEINADETTNAQALFEQACNERMQQFDDPDSDEDLWEDKEITFSKSVGGRASSPNQNAPVRKQRHSSDSEEDEQNEDSTDSEEELDSPRRIYQVPSSTTSTTTSTSTSSITSTSGNANIENMDVDSSDAWADFTKAPATTTTNPVEMETGASPWEQQQQQQQQKQQQQSEAQSASGENWAKFDEIFSEKKESAESSSSEESKTEKTSEEKWANFTNFEEMESSEGKVVKSELRSVSPIAMDTNESPTPSSSRMAQYVVSSGAADSSQQVASSSTDDVSSPPDTPRQAWDTPRVPPVSSPSVPPADKTISSSSDKSDDAPSSVETTDKKSSETNDDVDESSSEVSSSTHSDGQNQQNESIDTSTDVDTGLPVLQHSPLSSSQQPESTGTSSTNTSTFKQQQQTSLSSASETSTTSSSNVNTTTESTASSGNDVEYKNPPPIDFLDEIDDEYGDDLNDNFNFLASSGLMSSGEGAQADSSEKTPDDTTSSTEATSSEKQNELSSNSDTKTEEVSSENKKIEEIRAQAQEALEEFSTTTGTSSAQNGPV